MTISERIITGWTSDSNCEASMRKSIASAMSSTNTICLIICALEKYAPEKPTSNPGCSDTTSLTVAIVSGTSEEGMSRDRG